MSEYNGIPTPTRITGTVDDEGTRIFKDTGKRAGFRIPWRPLDDIKLLDLRASGFSYDEIGAAMGRSSMSVKKRYIKLKAQG